MVLTQWKTLASPLKERTLFGDNDHANIVRDLAKWLSSAALDMSTGLA
jgi:hypothetical protein